MSRTNQNHAAFMLLVAIGMLVSAGASQAYAASYFYSYSYQMNSYDKDPFSKYFYSNTQASYPYQYHQNAYRMSGSGNYVGGYGQHGISPFSISSTTCNTLLGCRQNYNSYIYIGNALDYTYYMHPELLAPRYMDNHQRQVTNLWPQAFTY